jgi:hypothetical protein
MFKLQINWCCTNTPEWKSEWTTVGEMSTLEKALKRLKFDSDLSRVCGLLRVIDETGFVHARYNPELDYRLPGCFWRRVQKRAYQLWEESNNNESQEYFWLRAERQLLEEKNEGIFEGDFTQEELDMNDWRFDK